MGKFNVGDYVWVRYSYTIKRRLGKLKSKTHARYWRVLFVNNDLTGAYVAEGRLDPCPWMNGAVMKAIRG